MKKPIIIIVVCVAFVVGAAVGFCVSTYYAGCLSASQTIASSLYNVSASYAPLKLLKDGKTEKATTVLEIELDSAMRNLDLMAETLNRPDILTNSYVVKARVLK